MNSSVSTVSSTPIRNLALRQNDGVEVGLWWNSETEEITVSVESPTQNFTIRDIPHNSALDAWNHPFAYADFMLKSGKVISNACV